MLHPLSISSILGTKPTFNLQNEKPSQEDFYREEACPATNNSSTPLTQTENFNINTAEKTGLIGVKHLKNQNPQAKIAIPPMFMKNWKPSKIHKKEKWSEKENQMLLYLKDINKIDWCTIRDIFNKMPTPRTDNALISQYYRLKKK